MLALLLDSQYSGSPANPPDKNLAFYAPPGSMQKYPIAAIDAFTWSVDVAQPGTVIL